MTDAAINIFPDLETKVDIVQNAIDMAHAFERERPKVAILSAVETVTPKIPSTIDAAALCKMAERGQITGALLDGPLAFDNAISKEAAQIKGIRSEVAGDPDILVVPDLEAGNMLAKQLSFLANADAAGIVLGARVPIILTSRADTVRRAWRPARSPCCSPTPAGSSGVPWPRSRRMADAVLTINAGSSSLKFSVYRSARDELELSAKGQVEGIGTSPRLVAEDAMVEAGRAALADDRGSGHAEFFRVIGSWLREHFGDGRCSASVTGWCTAASTMRRRCASIRRCSPGWRRSAAGAAASAAQSRRHPRGRRGPARPAAGGLLRYRLPPRPSRARRLVRPAAPVL